MQQASLVTDVLTLEAAAQYLRISGALLERQAAAGIIPGRQIGANWRFRKQALDEWLDRRDYRALAGAGGGLRRRPIARGTAGNH